MTNVTSRHSTGHGIMVGGDMDAVVINSEASHALGDGLIVGDRAALQASASKFNANGDHGIHVLSTGDVEIADCDVSENGSTGIAVK